MKQTVLFLDDGGVISDNATRARQWYRLVGEFFSPRLGGTPQQWAEANRVHTTDLFAPGPWTTRLEKYRDYRSFQDDYLIEWMQNMCRLAGVPQPGPAESIRLAEEATRWITPQVNAGYPGAADTIRLLHGRGHTLYTASGEASTELEGYLSAIGVREYFQTLYGTDLVDLPPKAGPVYYERMFADSGVPPEDSVVVDDNPAALAWAASMGARGVLVDRNRGRAGRSGAEQPGVVAVIEDLTELPGVLDKLE